MKIAAKLISSRIAPQALPLIINCAHRTHRGAFFEEHTRGFLRWEQFAAEDPFPFCLTDNGNLRRFAACNRAAHVARRMEADLVVTHDPRISFAVQYFLQLHRYQGPHLAFAFNYPWLPRGIKGSLHRAGFQGIDRFIVFSSVEREIYHNYFGIPLERIEFIPWGVAPPCVDFPDRPLIDGDYLCAIGGNSRDYRTFIESVRRLPELKVVLVVRPENIAGIDLPGNVRALVNIPLGEAMNVLAFSRFMALPLNSADVPCGHITLVHAMHLGKAFAITRSAGVADYVREGENALMFPVKNVDEMTEVLRKMWRDRDLCERLGEKGQRFAAEHCTEECTFTNFKRIIRELGVHFNDDSH